jgi:hypothetical protein
VAASFRLGTDITFDSRNEAVLNLGQGAAAPEAHLAASGGLEGHRLLECGARFVQVCHRGWDVRGNLPEVLPSKCKNVGQGAWALVQDLKQRGMLEDTLVIWDGEFGRPIYSQGKFAATEYGRDHHPRCHSIWLAREASRAVPFTTRPASPATT